MEIFFTGFTESNRNLAACLAKPTRESDLVNQTTNWGVFSHIPASQWKETRSPLRNGINKAAISDFFLKEVKFSNVSTASFN